MNKSNAFLNIFWIVILFLLLSDCTYNYKGDIKKWKEVCEGKQICYMYSRKSSVNLKDSTAYIYQHMVYTSLFDSINLLNAKELIKLAESYLDTINYAQPATTVSFFNAFEGISYPAYQNYINEHIAFKNRFASVGFKATIINEEKYNYSLYSLSILKDGEVVKELDSLEVDRLMKN